MANRSCAFAVTLSEFAMKRGGGMRCSLQGLSERPFLDSARRKPSEIPSTTRSVSAFLLRQSLESPFLRPFSLTVAWILDVKRHIDEGTELKGATRILIS